MPVRGMTYSQFANIRAPADQWVRLSATQFARWGISPLQQFRSDQKLYSPPNDICVVHVENDHRTHQGYYPF